MTGVFASAPIWRKPRKKSKARARGWYNFAQAANQRKRFEAIALVAKAESLRLRAELQQVVAENLALTAENLRLKTEVAPLRLQVARLFAENEELWDHITWLKDSRMGESNMTEWAIVAIAPKGSTMVVSCHSSEEEADQECARLATEKPAWSYHTQCVVED